MTEALTDLARRRGRRQSGDSPDWWMPPHPPPRFAASCISPVFVASATWCTAMCVGRWPQSEAVTYPEGASGARVTGLSGHRQLEQLQLRISVIGRLRRLSDLVLCRLTWGFVVTASCRPLIHVRTARARTRVGVGYAIH